MISAAIVQHWGREGRSISFQTVGTGIPNRLSTAVPIESTTPIIMAPTMLIFWVSRHTRTDTTPKMSHCAAIRPASVIQMGRFQLCCPNCTRLWAGAVKASKP